MQSEPPTAKRSKTVGDGNNDDVSFLAVLPERSKHVKLCFYSFLTAMDRLSLRRVSVAFYKDNNLCHTLTGVYGPNNITILQAFQQVKEYLEFSTTPDCLDSLEGCNMAPFWEQSGLGDLMEKTDYKWPQKIAGLYNAANGGTYQVEGLEKPLRRVLRKINKIRQKLQALLPILKNEIVEHESEGSSPYNLLFELLEKYELPWDIFWNAERTRLQDDAEHEYEIVRNGGLPECISHLRPGLKILFDTERGVIECRIIKECDECFEVKDDVVSERCGKAVGSLECFHEKSVCRGCTTKGTCSSCGGTFCMDEVHGCNLIMCSAEGCTSFMCHASSERFFSIENPDWYDTICSYKLKGEHFCVIHKPEGALPSIRSRDWRLW